MAKILIIDDDALFSDLLSDILMSFGHQSFQASGGAEALGMIHAGCAPDLILVDLRMERMDGLGAIDAIRNANPELRAGIVMLTASTCDDVAADARERGAIGFLSKPVRADQLNAQIARFLNDAKLVWMDDHHTITRAA